MEKTKSSEKVLQMSSLGYASNTAATSDPPQRQIFQNKIVGIKPHR